VAEQTASTNDDARVRAQSWAVFVGFIALGLLHITIDPFGLGDDFKQTVQDFLMRTTLGPHYGYKAPVFEEPSEYVHQSSVVLLRESSLSAMNKQFAEAYGQKPAEAEAGASTQETDAHISWPLKLSMHARILDAIITQGPRAVFVDILFRDRRANSGAEVLKSFLVQTAKYAQRPSDDPLSALGVPIFFAEDRDDEAPMHEDLIDPRCYDFDKLQWRTEEVWPKELPERTRTICRYFRSHLLPVPKSPENGILRTYESSQDGRLTTAFALLRRIELASAWSQEAKTGLGPSTADLELVWGSRPHPTNEKWMGESVRVEGNDESEQQKEYRRIPCRKISYLSTAAPCTGLCWLWDLLFDSKEAFEQSCPYVATVPVESLLFWNEDPDVPPLIKDKVIFYGVDLRGASDVVYPPNHKSLPGVYIHAMALENLLTAGPDYLRRLERPNDFLLEFAALLALAAIMKAVWHKRANIERGQQAAASAWTLLPCVQSKPFADSRLDPDWLVKCCSL